MEDETIEAVLTRLSIEAGELILEVYRRPDVDVRSKDDSSPVTEADEAATRLEAEENPFRLIVDSQSIDAAMFDIHDVTVNRRSPDSYARGADLQLPTGP